MNFFQWLCKIRERPGSAVVSHGRWWLHSAQRGEVLDIRNVGSCWWRHQQWDSLPRYVPFLLSSRSKTNRVIHFRSLESEEYLEFFSPDFVLHPEVNANKRDNGNTMQYLDSINQFVRENLRQLEHAPGIQMQDVPRDLIDLDNLDHKEDDPHHRDVRETTEELERRSDKKNIISLFPSIWFKMFVSTELFHETSFTTVSTTTTTTKKRRRAVSSSSFDAESQQKFTEQRHSNPGVPRPRSPRGWPNKQAQLQTKHTH